MKKFVTPLILSICVAGASAQFSIGGKNIDLQKAASAAKDAASAITLSDDDVAKLSAEAVVAMDRGSVVEDGVYHERLQRLVGSKSNYKGLKLNFKVYKTDEVNAFACADGSIRVYTGLMDRLTDDQIVAVVGHEIGHIMNKDTRDAMRNAYKASAVRNAAGAVSGSTLAKLSESQLGALAVSFTQAQYSQKQEYAADDYAFDFTLECGADPYAMANVLTLFVSMSKAGGAQSNAIQQLFSSHPDSEKRAVRMKAKADSYKSKMR